MKAERLTFEDAARQSQTWNRLAGPIPFRRWEWLGTWWKHYGRDRQWLALAVRDDSGEMRGIAPFFTDTAPAFGQCLSLLGSGDVCSDYVSILCADEDVSSVSAAVADWLMTAPGGTDWDIASLEGVSSDCPSVAGLLLELEHRDCIIHQQEALSTWQVELPASWDAYLKSLSKPNRRHVRTLQERLVDTGLVTIHAAKDHDDFDSAWQHLMELHQKRQQSVGKPGCFASNTFARFLREAATAFFAQGELELLVVNREEGPIAVQIAFIGGNAKYAYQIGIDPDRLCDSPGWLAHTQSIKRGIESGHHTFDFLRGNEPHKQRMGACPRSMNKIRVIPPRLGPAMLHRAWMTGKTVKGWIKAGLEKSGIR